MGRQRRELEDFLIAGQILIDSHEEEQLSGLSGQLSRISFVTCLSYS